MRCRHSHMIKLAILDLTALDHAGGWRTDVPITCQVRDSPTRAQLVLVCAALLLWLDVRTAQAGALIDFPNVNENTQPSRLPGYLAKPDGSGPFPAVVILHGCAGFFSSYASVADDLRWEGYVALAIDSLGPRGIADACVGRFSAQAIDAFAALAYLSKQNFVDRSRIAVLGYSMGGGAALMDVEPDSIGKLFLSSSFAAAIAYYPWCKDRSAIVTSPTMILVGADDDWTPAEYCREMVARPRDGGAALDLTIYPGAHHAFDNPKLTPGMHRFGHWLEYNEPAATDAWAKVLAFLAANLSRPITDNPPAR
jgi:dienelactone hydrolase